jgi:hypothetical protein
MRPLWGELQAGERRQRDEAGARPVDDVRFGRIRRFDDSGVGLLNVP